MNKISECDKLDIINLYVNENWTVQQIADKYKCDAGYTMKNTLVELGVEIRDSKFKQQYNIDRDFFKVIDNEEKAYWLGFLYADGYILRSHNRIQGFGCTLSIEDLSHLEKLKMTLKSEHNIEIRNEQFYDKEEKYLCKKSCRLDIRIKEMAKDLINLGCMPAKSLILKYPTIEQMPLNLQYHFIRGYFDGDGSVIFSNQLKKYRMISILGTEHMLKNITKILDLKFSFRKVASSNNTYEIGLSSQQNIYEFYNRVYNAATIYLDRKYQQFLKQNNFI